LPLTPVSEAGVHVVTSLDFLVGGVSKI